MRSEEEELELELAEVSDDQLAADICRERFYCFFLEFWETIETVELVPNWHIEYLCDQLQDVYERWARGEAQPDVLVNIPPGTSKSTTITQLFPAWLWLKHPPMRVISSSFAASLSVSNAVRTRDCVNSPKFQRLFPGLIQAKADQDGKTDYRNTRGGQRFSTSTMGAVTGNHADFIFIDDPLNPQAAVSEAGRAGAQAHLKTLSTRKTDKARSVTIMVMQRVHELDPAGVWLASGRPLRHICLPGELSDRVKPAELAQRYSADGLLDPNRLNRAALDGLKVALGSYGYAGQIQQVPTPDEGGILKKAWFRVETWANFLEKVPGAKSAFWHGDADTAYTEKNKNDPSALLISAYLPATKTLYIRYAGEMRLELNPLCMRLLELTSTHGFHGGSRLYVEPKASGKSVVQEIRRLTNLNVVEAPAPVGGKLERVHPAAPFIEAGRVVLIDGSWNEAFIQQCAAFPMAAHDDMLDCLTQAIARAKQPTGGFGFA